MAQPNSAVFQFGSGVAFAYPSGGNTSPNPTPMQFGSLQDVDVQISMEAKELYGRNTFPDAIARGKGKITGKAKFGQFNSKLVNDLLFGTSATMSAGQLNYTLDYVTSIPATPFTVTVVPPASGVFADDRGVKFASNGLSLTCIGSTGTPITGQYTVSAVGLYTFAAADTLLGVLISYDYTTVPATSGGNITLVTNSVMGTAPRFVLDLHQPFNGLQSNLRLFACMASKLSRTTKGDDFTVPDFEFSAVANAAGQVLQLSDAY